MKHPAPRRMAARVIPLDRAFEALPVFRLSDSADDAAITYSPEQGGRWRVLPSPGDRLPGTFDQDVYIEICRRFIEASSPSDGIISFTLHAFLRSIGRRADGRTYEQLRSALNRLLRTSLESSGTYWNAALNAPFEGRFSILTSVAIDRRRVSDRDQLALFPAFASPEPGDATITLSPIIRANLSAGFISSLSVPHYQSLSSPVARRLYRLLEVARSADQPTWSQSLEALAEQLPLLQRYPSHLQRVLQPAHEMLLATGIVRDIQTSRSDWGWEVVYSLAPRGGN
ncbi:MAG TPA: replication initiator protein A [Gemmatimonadaceae bacterium]|nr:replication initiator protein A [Gemmatimonadaceae bacterium]